MTAQWETGQIAGKETPRAQVPVFMGEREAGRWTLGGVLRLYPVGKDRRWGAYERSVKRANTWRR